MKTKQLLLSAVAALGFATAALAQNVPGYVPTNGLVGYWGFDGNAQDYSGNGNHGTVNGATLTTDRNGNANKAYSFDGINDRIVVNDANSLDIQNGQSLTISVWIKHNLSSSNIDKYILSKYSGNINTSAQYAIGTGQLGQAYTTTQIAGGITNHIDQRGDNVINDGNWHNFTYVWNNNESVKLFIDNDLDISKSHTLSGGIINSINLHFGCGANLSQFYTGNVDDIGIWNRALTQQEITELYTGCKLNASITPTNAFVNAGANGQFTANAADASATFQWQSNPSSFGWQNAPNNPSYSGANTASLTVKNVQLGNHLQPFRVIATAGNCADTSATAYLQLTDTCVKTVIDTNYVNQTIYDTTQITVTDTNYVTIYDTLTTYISVTDTLYININTVGLNNNSAISTIKVFPNPSNSIINLYYGNYANLNNYRLKITNALSQTIYDQPITQQSETIDLSTFGGKGIYYLSILNPQGNVIELRKIVLQ